MAAPKKYLLLLNFVIERCWFDLLIAEFGQVFNRYSKKLCFLIAF